MKSKTRKASSDAFLKDDTTDGGGGIIASMGTKEAKLAASAIGMCVVFGLSAFPAHASFDSTTSQSLLDDAKAYVVEFSSSGGGVNGSVKISSKLNRSLQETVTFDFNGLNGLAPNTKHAINVHDKSTGKSWNPDVRPHGAPDSVKKFGASACHFVGDGCVLNRHIGDLGNITVDGDGSIQPVKDIYVSLRERNSNSFIGGKVLVIRENKDDFVTEENDGNAGKIIASGIITPI